MALPALPVFGYFAVYFLFRIGGKLSVNAAGWHAGGIEFSDRIMVTALGLFSFFQPVMRLESALARGMGKLTGGSPREQGVSDVVVEVVSMA